VGPKVSGLFVLHDSCLLIFLKVRRMDEISTMDPIIIKECFEHGLMGVEIDPSFGGNGALSVTTALPVVHG
jgi:hypothetical protein